VGVSYLPVELKGGGDERGSRFFKQMGEKEIVLPIENESGTG